MKNFQQFNNKKDAATKFKTEVKKRTKTLKTLKTIPISIENLIKENFKKFKNITDNDGPFPPRH